MIPYHFLGWESILTYMHVSCFILDILECKLPRVQYQCFTWMHVSYFILHILDLNLRLGINTYIHACFLLYPRHTGMWATLASEPMLYMDACFVIYPTHTGMWMILGLEPMPFIDACFWLCFRHTETCTIMGWKLIEIFSHIMKIKHPYRVCDLVIYLFICVCVGGGVL